MPASPRSHSDPGDPANEPSTRRYDPVTVISMGLGIFLVTLWIGITLIGDTLRNSVIMAILIVILAAAGFAFNQRPQRKR